jgi:cell division protein FtsZ
MHATAAVAMPAGVGPAPAPVMSVQAHALRHPAPQLVSIADGMPDTASMMEAAAIGAPAPAQAAMPVNSVTASVQGVGFPPPRAGAHGSRASLFADPPRQTDAASPAPAPEATRPSLFSTVTGAFRRRQHPAAAAGESAPPVRAEPVMQQTGRTEPPQASVRQTAGEEVGLDIPAFLRRQSS